MNGFELERWLAMIDANVEANRLRQRAEVMQFIRGHEEDVLAQLRTNREAVVPTSLGTVRLRLSDIEKAVAAAA